MIDHALASGYTKLPSYDPTELATWFVNACSSGTLELYLETFEHTRLKPLSVPLVVEDKSRLILAAGVAQMPAKGLLAQRSLKKYGYRKDLRPEAWQAVRAVAKAHADPQCHILSDNNPHYSRHIRHHFPLAVHATTPGGRGCIAGYGELKKKGYDPMFSLNHTCASLRDNLACLKRRTWTTTKKPAELQKLLNIAIMSHNKRLIAKQGRRIRVSALTRSHERPSGVTTH